MSTASSVNNNPITQMSEFQRIELLTKSNNLITQFLKAGDLLKKGVDLNLPFASVRHQHTQGPNSNWQRQYSWLNERLLTVAPQDLPDFQKELQLEALTKNDMLALVDRIKGLVQQLQQKQKDLTQSGTAGEETDKLFLEAHQEIMPLIEKFDQTHPDFRLLKLPIDKLDRLQELVKKRDQPCRLLHGSTGDLLNIMFKNMLPSLFYGLNEMFPSMSGVDNTDQAYAMRMMMAQFSSTSLGNY